MNCRRIEELLPLFIEGDLSAEAMNEIASHLNTCSPCSQLVNEFGASQTWLRGFETPEFGNAFFMDLKQSVMREIEQSQMRPTWLERLKERWQPNLAFALAVAVLVLVGAFVLSTFKGSTTIEPQESVISSDDKQRDEQNEIEPKPDVRTPENAKENNRKFGVYRVKRSRPKVARKIIEPLPVAARQNFEPLDNLAVNIFETDLPANPLGLGGIPELPLPSQSTRIEFQTGDPNIRIIWFAPKLNVPNHSKVDTE